MILPHKGISDALQRSKSQNTCLTGFLFTLMTTRFLLFCCKVISSITYLWTIALILLLHVFLQHPPSFSGNGDDNIVLGLCVDRISQNEKVEVQLGAEYKELSPFCILLCLSLDGKLFMYQVARYSMRLCIYSVCL